MSWVTLGTVTGYDQNGAGYYLAGTVQYDDAQDVPNKRTKLRIVAGSGGPGSHWDLDVRAWSISVSAVASATGSGSISGSAAPDFRGTPVSGTSGEFWITHKSDGTAQITASASWAATSSGGWFDSGFSGSLGSTSLPTIISAPTAPSSVTATRSSDTQTGVTWTPNPSTYKPYTGQSVYVSIDGATRTFVQNVTATTSSYTYTSSANHKYVFTIDASNAAGSTTSAVSNTILTTPAALASLTAALVTSGTIRLTLPIRPTPYTEGQVFVEETHDAGVTWNSKTTIALSALSTSATTTWDDTSAQTSGNVQYRGTVRTTGGTQGTLSAAPTVSNILVLNTPPNAPTNLTPSGPVDASATVRLAWEHSPSVDGAAQSSRRARYSTDSGSTWTTIVSGDSTVAYYDWSISLGSFTAGETIVWQVATAGSQPGTYGAWSASQTLTLFGSLAVTLGADTPPTTHTGGPMPVAWTSSPTWGTASQAQYRVTLTDATGLTVYDTGMLAGTTEAVDIPSSVQVNDTAYTVLVVVVDSNGVTSQPATRSVTTDYLPPGPVVLDWSYDDESGTIVFTPTFTDPSESPVDDTYEWILDRSFDGLVWTRIGTAVGAVTIPDALVRVGGDSYYRSISVTELDVSGEPTVFLVPASDVTSMWGWLNYDEKRVRFGWSQTTDISSSRAADLYDIEGVTWPVAVFGQPRSRKLSVTGKLLSREATGSRLPAVWASSTASEMTALQEDADVCTFRDARGSWFACRVSDMKVSPARRQTGQPDEAAVSFTIERVSP